MTFDDNLAASVRAALAGTGAVREVKMFGGIGFMLNGNMVAGASKRGLLLRVGKDRQGDALAQPGARPMVMRGRTMEGYIYVDPPALNEKVANMASARGALRADPAAKNDRSETQADERKAEMMMQRLLHPASPSSQLTAIHRVES
jgi:TfoX/Sxy family transcriptional regulator of competence genes